jgi:phosphatidylserine/phosphatidylglycerophosphate/cardiolipin synthase-like enzyme
VFDRNEILTGSYNWTRSASRNNSENCLFIRDEAEKYQRRFNQLWKEYE